MKRQPWIGYPIQLSECNGYARPHPYFKAQFLDWGDEAVVTSISDDGLSGAIQWDRNKNFSPIVKTVGGWIVVVTIDVEPEELAD